MNKVFNCNKSKWDDCECTNSCRRGHEEVIIELKDNEQEEM
jgi:hypothetical protein